jgi:DNA polymerase III alpha subunit
MDAEDSTLKERYKKLNRFERMIVKHPVAFLDAETKKIGIVKKRSAGMFTVTAMISRVKYHWTKKDDKKMAFIDLEDETGQINLVIWADVLKKNYDKLVAGNIIEIKIRKDSKGCTVDGEKIKLIKEVYELVG